MHLATQSQADLTVFITEAEAVEIAREKMAMRLRTDLIVYPSDLLPGDILLHRSAKRKLHQKLIEKKTGSPYTHAAIFLGGGLVAEADVRHGVHKTDLIKSTEGSRCVAVLRSQMGFSPVRCAKLVNFVDRVIANNKSYNFKSVVNFRKNVDAFLDNQLEILNNSYALSVKTDEEFARASYFCSGLVVACYSVVGIIDGSAQPLFPANIFSPASLHDDGTFGWFLGYLIPENDPMLTKVTNWRDVEPDNTWLDER